MRIITFQDMEVIMVVMEDLVMGDMMEAMEDMAATVRYCQSDILKSCEYDLFCRLWRLWSSWLLSFNILKFNCLSISASIVHADYVRTSNISEAFLICDLKLYFLDDWADLLLQICDFKQEIEILICK